MMCIDIYYPPPSKGGIAIGNGASEQYLEGSLPDRFAIRIELVVGCVRFVVRTDTSERELPIAGQLPGFFVTCGSTDGESPSPILSVRCPAGPVAVFQVFDLMNGGEESDLVAVFDPSVARRLDAFREQAKVLP